MSDKPAGDPRADSLARLTTVRARLAAHAAAAATHGGLTAADERTGEQWDQGQVWAHLAEFQAFWLAQLERVVAGAQADPSPEPGAVPFGRTSDDPDRRAAIERDRDLPPAELWASVEAQAGATERFLRALDERGWEARGLHPRLGVMTMPAMVERFLIGHLEEHADQLDTLRR